MTPMISLRNALLFIKLLPSHVNGDMTDVSMDYQTSLVVRFNVTGKSSNMLILSYRLQCNGLA